MTNGIIFEQKYIQFKTKPGTAAKNNATLGIHILWIPILDLDQRIRSFQTFVPTDEAGLHRKKDLSGKKTCSRHQLKVHQKKDKEEI